ncbi:hypothetical protein McanCB56680_000354 [Microsporum canis]
MQRKWGGAKKAANKGKEKVENRIYLPSWVRNAGHDAQRARGVQPVHDNPGYETFVRDPFLRNPQSDRTAARGIRRIGQNPDNNRAEPSSSRNPMAIRGASIDDVDSEFRDGSYYRVPSTEDFDTLDNNDLDFTLPAKTQDNSSDSQTAAPVPPSISENGHMAINSDLGRLPSIVVDINQNNKEEPEKSSPRREILEPLLARGPSDLSK